MVILETKEEPHRPTQETSRVGHKDILNKNKQHPRSRTIGYKIEEGQTRVALVKGAAVKECNRVIIQQLISVNGKPPQAVIGQYKIVAR
jgi:hypothetical protein